MRQLWSFIRLTRPVFLLGGALLYWLGVIYALRQGVMLRLDHALLGQVMVTAIQLLAQYANEYYDVEADCLNTQRTWFSGGSGVLPTGEMDRGIVRQAMSVCACVGGIAILIAITQSPWVGLVGLLGLAGAWFYSAPPLTLMSSGWGELSASVLVALLTPLIGFMLQTDRLNPGLLFLCAPLMLIHIAMLIAFEFPDWQADVMARKRTLAVRLGLERAALVHGVLIIVALALLVGMALVLPTARYALGVAPLALWQVLAVVQNVRHVWTQMQWLTLSAAGLFTLTSVLALVGLLIAG